MKSDIILLASGETQSIPTLRSCQALTFEDLSFLHGFMSGEGLEGVTDASLFDDFCLV